MASCMKVCFAVLVLVGMAYAYPRAYPVAIAIPDHPIGDGYGPPVIPYPVPVPEPYHPALGRVKIQAYRGPNKDKVGYEYFAPWGYYATQPADLKVVHGYH